ncbi:Lar family restriction alleviation protein [Novosphingobium sp. JCM 18896]|uniref:Lar family restriction alleviation protein n=1 Tax=Novosphingobium sp. JCM 18896 TaxID=2989731 RepID=UPI002222D2DA|nr:Lar family restriction alleviation protein [Novosphingobium sp. JCM 18896]MCW1431353.1 Lar family restriction alleviation protein [Novosphingobium sp. JCM 18896]
MTKTPEQAVIQATLLPCPFCGGEAELGGYQTAWYVRCQTDECWAETYGALYIDATEAIAAWNTRLAHSQSASEGLRETWLRLRHAITGVISDVECALELREGLDALHYDGAQEARAAADAMDAAFNAQPLTEPQRFGQEGEAYDIASRISVSEFPGNTFAERLENARIVLAALTPAQAEPVALDAYDAGLLNDYGGGDVNWWQDYIRAELGRAHDFYAAQFDAHPPAPPLDREAVVERMARAIHEHCCKRDVMTYLANKEDCLGLAQAALDAALPLLAEERGERS